MVRSRVRRSRPGSRAGGAADGVQFPASTRTRVTIASRSASAPGDGDQGGGISGSGGVPSAPRARRPPSPTMPDPGPRSCVMASANLSISSVTSGGTRSPVARSAAEASANGWLALSTAIRCMSRPERPLELARQVSIAS